MIVNKFKRMRGICFSAKEALALQKGVPQDDHSQFRGEEEELQRELSFAVKHLEAIRELCEMLLIPSARITFGPSKYNQIFLWIDLLPLYLFSFPS